MNSKTDLELHIAELKALYKATIDGKQELDEFYLKAAILEAEKDLTENIDLSAHVQRLDEEREKAIKYRNIEWRVILSYIIPRAIVYLNKCNEYRERLND